jgi:hypothetical protein
VIASDLWTSKNSVYAFAGCVGFWIDSDWKLVEIVLDMIALDGDHTGAATRKLLFHALQE